MLGLLFFVEKIYRCVFQKKKLNSFPQNEKLKNCMKSQKLVNIKKDVWELQFKATRGPCSYGFIFSYRKPRSFKNPITGGKMNGGGAVGVNIYIYINRVFKKKK